MKKVMFALCFMFGGIVVVSAQDTTSTQYRNQTETESQYGQDAQSQNEYQQQDRQRIQSTDLPDEVKRTLEGEEYRGWLVSGAFKAKATESDMQSQNGQENHAPDVNEQQSNQAITGEDAEIYIVELKNGAETQTLRFDKDGNKLEDMEQSGQEMNGQDGANHEYNQHGERNESDQYNQNGQYDQNDQSGQNSQPDQGSEYNQSGQPDNQSGQMDRSSSQDWSRESSGQPSQGVEDQDQSSGSQSPQSTGTETTDDTHATEQQ